MRKIYIKTTTGMGRTYDFDIESFTTIKQLKEQFLKKTKSEKDGQNLRFVFNEEILEDDSRILSTYGIEDESMLQVINLDDRTRNGAFRIPTFIDVSNSKGLKRVGWAKTIAPAWRIASPGLCLEGVCYNKDCKAYQQSVIMSMGFIRFDIIVDADGDTTKCPLCHKYVNPTTCGFSNCWWRYEGKKQNENKSPEKCSCDWQQADDAYHYFDEDKSGNVTWKQLIVEAVQNKPK
ncbi:hypothetical protein I4U23_023534 [Adineta vaga]|nr:hypothetical protein I4U23_023534 [Adineta vaga]